jgi:hypothetical protein
VIRSFIDSVFAPAHRSKFYWLIGSCLSALVLGFGAVSPHTGQRMIVAGGYYYILGLFVLFVFFARRVVAGHRGVIVGWLRRPGLAGFFLLAATVFALWSDPFKHKILFDEYVLQSTAMHMHTTKEIGAVIRAYPIAGSWTPIDAFLDKRPYFFAFLVSLLHDLTGYRIANIFILNVVLTPVFFGLVYWLARTFAGRGPALLAVGLLATMPLLGQQSTGAGMELHNLTMIALVMALAVLYLRQPDDDRLSLLILGTLLLAQSRYESVLFVFSTALIVVVGWRRADRVLLPWIALAAPLLLVPYVWHNRMLSASPLLWQLQEGQTERFSMKYLAGNLSGAWHFFFSTGIELANSWYLSALGVAGLVWALGCAWKWKRRNEASALAPEKIVLLAYSAGIAANLALLMFYYWSRLNDLIASRFALPTCLLLALLAAFLVQNLQERRLPATRCAFFGLGLWLFVWCLPTVARRLYTDQNILMKEIEWEHSVLLTRSGPVLFISNTSTIPFILWHVPALLTVVGRNRGEQIAYHLKEKTFREVLIVQVLRPTSAEGELGIDPDDVMPDSFQLEMIAEKRFGARWTRISRLVAITSPQPPLTVLSP